MEVSQVQLKCLRLCPRSWKLLALFKELKILHCVENIDLKDPEKFPAVSTKTEECKTDISYILANLDEFFVTKAQKRAYGRWFSEIECDFIPLIVMPIRFERVINPIVKRKTPDNVKLAYKRKELKEKLRFYSSYFNENNWLIENYFSLADITLAAAIAVLDYLGEINWQDKTLVNLYNWYLKIKSRGSFEVVLEQKCQGIIPHANFKNMDF